eukprot:scaffold22938_cov56-Phaeocystis_antarctica.AAC.3
MRRPRLALPGQAVRKLGANHIRSSLMMVLEDTATVGTAGVGSSGPPEDREAGCRVYPGLSGAQP